MKLLPPYLLLILSPLFVWPSTSLSAPHRSVAPESAPVYTKPYAGIPTGHYSVPLLYKKMIRKENMNWVFVKDLRTGKMGWTPRDQLLSPLHFSTKARLLAKSPVFGQRTDNKSDPSLIPQSETDVAIDTISGEWANIQIDKKSAWVHTSYLLPLEKDPGFFYTRNSVRLKSDPRNKAENLIKIPAGQKLVPHKVLREWALVTYENKKGYIPLSEVVHRIHVANKVRTPKGLIPAKPNMIHDKIFAVYVDPLWLGTGIHVISLYSEPSVAGTATATIPPWTSLQQQESITQEWAISNIDSLGPVWWQTLVPGKTTMTTNWKRLIKGSLKTVIHNPIFPELRIGLADTLYRSNDGVHWSMLRNLQNPQPAFAYSKDGILFIDDTLSMDNGETLTPFIQWESVLGSLRDENIGVAENLKILNIYSVNGSSRNLIYELDVGGQRPIKLQTLDRGVHWTLLR
jgi:hypothetical protein